MVLADAELDQDMVVLVCLVVLVAPIKRTSRPIMISPVVDVADALAETELLEDVKSIKEYNITII